MSFALFPCNYDGIIEMAHREGGDGWMSTISQRRNAISQRLVNVSQRLLNDRQ